MRQAETQKQAADGAVTARLPETYQWLLVPVQALAAGAGRSGRRIRLAGQDALAVRASKKLRSDELLVTGFAGTRLRMELDRVPLWRGDHVAVKQLVEDFARYLYLPRLAGPEVLVDAVRDGVALLTWAAGRLRLRRQLRRGDRPLPRPAKCATCRLDPPLRRRPAGEGRGGRQAAGSRPRSGGCRLLVRPSTALARLRSAASHRLRP